MRWRMQLAATLLRTRDTSVFEAAMAVGYASEAAFSRAFKRVVGVPPAAWREGRRKESPPPGRRRPVAPKPAAPPDDPRPGLGPPSVRRAD